MFDSPEPARDRLEPADLSYARAVLPSVHDVAAELRARRPHLGKVAVHKLLYFAQGHHLATFNRPLFRESLYAWDNGPVVSDLWKSEEDGLPIPEPTELGEAELNSLGYVLSRYGALSARDLINLSHSQEPWKLADANRRPGTSRRIEASWITEYFTGDQGDEDIVPLDADEVDDWLRDAAERRDVEGPVDDPASLAARIRELRERAAG
jgi:uncharacterized phage-associated protein